MRSHVEHVSLAHKKNEKGVRREYDKTVETHKKRGSGTSEMWRPAKQSSSTLDGAPPHDAASKPWWSYFSVLHSYLARLKQ